ncbi:MAG: hypothetical protein E6I76_06150 [Chloroflexi bacterium]|nr:MAG: hypothetical protein E6I76_06150 [Chloroflexota bacterium]
MSEPDWADEVADETPAPPDDEAPTLDETGDEASLRADDSDERIRADEEAKLADAEMHGTGGSYSE